MDLSSILFIYFLLLYIMPRLQWTALLKMVRGNQDIYNYISPFRSMHNPLNVFLDCSMTQESCTIIMFTCIHNLAIYMMLYKVTCFLRAIAAHGNTSLFFFHVV